MTEANSWAEYSKMVLQELEYHHETLEEVKTQLTQMRVELARDRAQLQKVELLEGRIALAEKRLADLESGQAVLHVKSGLWAAAATAVTVMGALLLKLIHIGGG